MEPVGRYQILEELGRGAHGVVYRALDPAIGRTIAIKAIAMADFSAEDRERVREGILREARLAGTLSHPNIVTVYDVLESTASTYIVMEYVDGKSLEWTISSTNAKRPDGLTRAGFLSIFKQVAQALDYAHRKGVIHRDIKPANIVLADQRTGKSDRGEGEPLAKIADFGVAKFASQEVTQQLGGKYSLIGTPNYMSPEQVQGAAVSGASDQFSLGVIAYEVLCGRKAFSAVSIETLLYRIRHEREQPVDEMNPALSATVGKVMRRALSKKPEERFGTCSEFAGALEFALGGSPGWAPGRVVVADAAPTTVAPKQTAPKLPEPKLAEPKLPEPRQRAAVAGAGRVQEQAPPAVRPAVPAASSMPEKPAISVPRPDFRVKTSPTYATVAVEEVDEAKPWGKKLAVIGALCLAVVLAILLIVRVNSGPATPALVLDSRNGSVSPPPAVEDLKSDRHTVSAPAPAAIPKKAENATTVVNVPVPAAPRPKPEVVKPAPVKTEVEMLTDPLGAEIRVDGAVRCTSPCSVSLSPGRHTLAALKYGFGVSRKILNVPANRNVFIPMIRVVGVLAVSSEPSGASVNVDGKAAGHTPLTLRLPPGLHRVSVWDGARWHDENVRITADSVDTRTFRF